ncbi:hypothetical protein CspeluHIS016_0700530 [Cutaneotrichosporon spelunceum]|uniref:Uncharacterized protein n=1 Tax=Cutaneotrichosporon spelunceum TaxID=1672016 RepID=A0AAD3TY39_9TREE|nr:hypothetical protein CspeluHIS016_0700530 [Cutaneotrichosporon spelunceum]
MPDDVATLIRQVLPPLPDDLRTRYAALFNTDDIAPLERTLENDYPEATRRRRTLPAKLSSYDDFGVTDRQASSIALDAWLTQFAAGVKGTQNPDMKYDTYLPSCFYDWLARGVGAADLSLNLSEALTVAGHRDVSYTDSQLFFPVAFKDRWGFVHVSYVEDRITVFDPASADDKDAQEVLGVVQAHIAAADKAHFDKTHKLKTHVMSCGRVSPQNSTLVVCAALEAFPSRHFRDERCAPVDKLTEAIEADTPLADLVGSEVQVGVRKASVIGGVRDALRDRAKFTWATGVPVNAEGIEMLAKEEEDAS